MTDIQEKESWEDGMTPLLKRTWDNQAGYYDWRDFIAEAIETAIKNREREIAMEVEKMRKEPSYTDYEHEAYNQTLDKILSIINTPQ